MPLSEGTADSVKFILRGYVSLFFNYAGDVAGRARERYKSQPVPGL